MLPAVPSLAWTPPRSPTASSRHRMIAPRSRCSPRPSRDSTSRGPTTCCSRSVIAAAHPDGSRSAGRSASPTAPCGLDTTSGSRCGRRSGIAPSHLAPEGAAQLDLEPLVQPRIETEVVFRFRADLPATDDAQAVLEHTEWIAAGFEIVQSHFAGWRFAAADCTAAFGLHGALVVGRPLMLTDTERGRLLTALTDADVTVRRGDDVVDTGRSSVVLDSPALSLAHLSRGLDGAGRCGSRRRRHRHDRHDHRRVARHGGRDVVLGLRVSGDRGPHVDVHLGRLRPTPCVAAGTWPPGLSRRLGTRSSAQGCPEAGERRGSGSGSVSCVAAQRRLASGARHDDLAAVSRRRRSARPRARRSRCSSHRSPSARRCGSRCAPGRRRRRSMTACADRAGSRRRHRAHRPGCENTAKNSSARVSTTTPPPFVADIAEDRPHAVDELARSRRPASGRERSSPRCRSSSS